jgi:glutaredoxin-like protein
MMSEPDRTALERKFGAGMVDAVGIQLFVEEGSAIGKELVSFVNMFAGLNALIKVEVHDPEGGKSQRMRDLRIENYPCIVFTKGDFSRIRYYGIPGGYEMPAFVDAIVELSASKTPLSPKAKASLATVRRKANIKVFVLTTCPFCPTVVRHAFRGAIESQRVTSEVIDSQMLPDLSARHSVLGVPKIVLNDNLDITGAVTDVEFFEKLRDSDHALIDSMYG